MLFLLDRPITFLDTGELNEWLDTSSLLGATSKQTDNFCGIISFTVNERFDWLKLRIWPIIAVSIYDDKFVMSHYPILSLGQILQWNHNQLTFNHEWPWI